MLHFNDWHFSRFYSARDFVVENDGSRTAIGPVVTKSSGQSMGASASVDQAQAIYSNVERAVPRTPRGSRDVEHCDRAGLKDVISHAQQDVARTRAALARCLTRRRAWRWSVKRT